MADNKKIYLQIKSIEKKPTVTTTAKAAAVSFSQKVGNLFSEYVKKIPIKLPKKRHFSAVAPGGTLPVVKAPQGKVLNRSFRELLRNPLRSLATTFIMALVLTTIGTSIMVSFITEQAIKIVDAKLDVSIEVQENVALDKVQSLVQELEILPYIRSVTYISKADALESFRKDHADLTDFLQTYNINNPLPASLRINVTDPKYYQQIITFLDTKEHSSVINLAKARDNFSERSRIEQLISITDTVKYFLYFFISLFVGIGVLIIVATVQLTLQQRKRELSIMQVVGASFRRILSPFIWESVFLSVISTVLALFVLFLVAAKLTPLATQYFDSQSVNMVAYIKLNALSFVSVLLGSGIVISVSVTLLTVWRYLRLQRLF